MRSIRAPAATSRTGSSAAAAAAAARRTAPGAAEEPGGEDAGGDGTSAPRGAHTRGEGRNASEEDADERPSTVVGRKTESAIRRARYDARPGTERITRLGAHLHGVDRRARADGTRARRFRAVSARACCASSRFAAARFITSRVDPAGESEVGTRGVTARTTLETTRSDAMRAKRNSKRARVYFASVVLGLRGRRRARRRARDAKGTSKRRVKTSDVRCARDMWRPPAVRCVQCEHFSPIPRFQYLIASPFNGPMNIYLKLQEARRPQSRQKFLDPTDEI